MFNFLYTKKTTKNYKTETTTTKSPVDKAFTEIEKAVDTVEEIMKKVFDDLENSASIECDDISVVVKDGRIEIKGKKIKQITVNGTNLYTEK